MDERVIAMQSADIPAEGGDVTLDVTRDWGPGVYVAAVLYRPMDITEKRMPGRAIGLTHAAVDPGARALAVTLTAPATIEPRQTIDVGLTVDGVANYANVALVTGGFFDVLRITPLHGRALALGDEHPRAEHVIVISSGLWHRQFSGSRDVIGSRVRLGEQPFTIVGVILPDLDYPTGVEIWQTTSAVASSARSAFSRPLPASLLTKASTCPATYDSAAPLSRTILRKKKSCAWMAVVPS